jgi:hypothetical protein
MTVLIGQGPSRTGDPAAPLAGRLGRKMSKLMGIGFDEYLAKFERRNVLRKWYGKASKGDVFPMLVARKRARRMRKSLAGKRVVFLGKKTAEAFGIRERYMKWIDASDFVAVVFPHPSGVNRWWNDPANVENAKTFLRKLVR